MQKNKKEIYSDIDISFAAHPVTKQLNRKKGRDAVKQSVKNLILTDFYESQFNPNLGCGLRYYLFENFTPAIKQQIESSIKEVIGNYEPRANVIEVLVEERPDMNALTISVAFTTNTESEITVLDVILERIR